LIIKFFGTKLCGKLGLGLVFKLHPQVTIHKLSSQPVGSFGKQEIASFLTMARRTYSSGRGSSKMSLNSFVSRLNHQKKSYC
jgi:hypothetical protein